MSAFEYNFEIEQGSALTITVTWYDEDNAVVNLTNYTADFVAKVNKSDSAAVIDSTTNMTITLGGVVGTIVLTMTGAQTAALTFDKAHYNLELIDGSSVPSRLMEGLITLSKETTG